MFDTPVDMIPKSLLSEGSAMLRALVEDFSDWAEVVVPIDSRLPNPLDDFETLAKNQIHCITMSKPSPPISTWIAAAHDCDAAIVIVPETDQLLTKTITMMRSAGIKVLAPGSSTVATFTDKWKTAKWLHGLGVPHPDVWSLEGHRNRPVVSRHTNSSSQSSVPASMTSGDQCWVKTPERLWRDGYPSLR